MNEHDDIGNTGIGNNAIRSSDGERGAGLPADPDSRVATVRSRAVAALFPEIPVHAERQVLGLGLIVGGLVFSALMGWGPLGQWVSGFSAPTRSASVALRLGPDPDSGTTPASIVAAAPSTAPSEATSATSATTATSTAVVTAPTTVPTPNTAVAAAPTTAAATPVPTSAAPAPADPIVGVTDPVDGEAPEGLTLYFGNGQTTPLDAELDKINTIVDTLAALPDGSSVAIVGHASSTGNPAANQALSLARADTVLRAVRVALGPKADRLTFTTAAKGDSESAGDPARSRRVTISVGGVTPTS